MARISDDRKVEILIDRERRSSMKIKEFCLLHNIPVATYYSWLKQFKPKLLEYLKKHTLAIPKRLLKGLDEQTKARFEIVRKTKHNIISEQDRRHAELFHTFIRKEVYKRLEKYSDDFKQYALERLRRV